MLNAERAAEEKRLGATKPAKAKKPRAGKATASQADSKPAQRDLFGKDD